jgi:hypothetical protein
VLIALDFEGEMCVMCHSASFDIESVTLVRRLCCGSGSSGVETALADQSTLSLQVPVVIRRESNSLFGFQGLLREELDIAGIVACHVTTLFIHIYICFYI